MTTAQNPVTIVLFGPLCVGKDFNHHPREADHLAVFVEAVVVSDGATPGYIVETVPKSVGILVVAGLPEALSRDVHVVVGGPKVPGKGDVLVAFPEVGKDFLGLLVVGVGSGSDGLQAGGRVAGDVLSGGSDFRGGGPAEGLTILRSSRTDRNCRKPPALLSPHVRLGERPTRCVERPPSRSVRWPRLPHN